MSGGKDGRDPKTPMQHIGKYILQDEIGQGGFGVVYKGTHRETGEYVAVKVLDKEQLQLSRMTQQIKRELTLFSMLRHDNIVQGKEVLSSKTKLYMVMELVTGGDLHTMLSKRHRLPEDEARGYFRDLLQCLTYCHGQGVFHRDLKLENLLISSSGALKVCDFGLASVRALNASTDQLCSTLVGTEDFAAPEVISGQTYDGAKADLWSAGVILYTMLAGCCPFHGDNSADIFRRIKSGRYTFPTAFPHSPRRLVSQLLVADAKSRPSASELLCDPWVEGCEEEEDEVFEMTHQFPRAKSKERAVRAGTPITLVQRGSGDTERLTAFGSRRIRLSSATPERRFSNARGSKHLATTPKEIRNVVAQNPGLALAAQTIQGFHELYSAMRSSNLVRDRRYRLRMYAATFVGSEMVTWLSQHLQVPREEALEKGETMLKAEVFHHVCRDHNFKDEYLFYRFMVDDPQNLNVLNIRQIWPSTTPARRPLEVVADLMTAMLALISLHQAIVTSEHEVPEVDVSGLRNDDMFETFRTASSELQAIDFSEFADENEELAFLVNLYNIMVFHAHIQVDSMVRSPRETLCLIQYNVGGKRWSAQHIAAILDHFGNPPWRQRISKPTLQRYQSVIPRATSGFGRLGKSQSVNDSTSDVELFKLSEDDARAAALLLATGTCTDLPVKLCSPSDVRMESIRKLVAEQLLENIYIDSQVGDSDSSLGYTVWVPHVMSRYMDLYGDNESDGANAVIQDLMGLLPCAEGDAAKEKALRSRLKNINKSGAPVSIEYEERNNTSFAPVLQERPPKGFSF